MVRATTLKRIPYYADSVAQAFVECVEEGALEDIQAMWYLELVRNMHESGADIAAYNILNGVFRIPCSIRNERAVQSPGRSFQTR